MTPIGVLLRTAYQACGMPADVFARLARLDAARLHAVEEGRAELSAAELDRCARVFGVTDDQVDRSLDGACTMDPRPAILVNLLEPERYPWRTRITLAHELCHLLFDEEVRERRALFSPHGKRRLFPGFEEIEQRARAFAACFLAPSEGVRAAVGSEDPTSEKAICSVGATFGVGRVVAINRLYHVFRLSDEERHRMDTRAGQPYHAEFAGDHVDEPLGFRGGALLELTREALRQDKVTAVRARKVLGLTVADPLPFPDLDEARREPLVSRADVMRRRGDQVLAERWPEAGLLAAEAHAQDDLWRVDIVGGGIGAIAPAPRTRAEARRARDRAATL